MTTWLLGTLVVIGFMAYFGLLFWPIFTDRRQDEDSSGND